MVNAANLQVELGHHAYPIHINAGCFEQVQHAISPYSHVFVLTDRALEKHQNDKLKALEGWGAKTIIMEQGEQSKNFDTYGKLCETLIEMGADRHSCLVALGGGVVGDLTGFVAATLLRGIDFIQIPTTLLSMVDSSVGGKTGINLSVGKNLVGAFYQPKAVFIDTDFLDTLPAREWRAGYAEIVKYGLIQDSHFFDFLDKNNLKETALVQAIQTSCAIKADIVKQDERETGDIRALLNFGHTFGHALEAYYGYDDRLNHGEAVSIGMAWASQFAVEYGVLEPQKAEKILKHLQKKGLPVNCSDLGLKAPDAPYMLGNMRKDKKNRAGQINLILLSDIGKAQMVKNIDDKKLLQFLKNIR